MRRETREREENRREMMRTEKAGEDSVSDGTSNESREPEKRKKRELVTAVRSTGWAPIRIPFRRRLQTAAVLWHTFSILICFSTFWFVLAIPLSWPILVPYLIYIFFLANNHADGSAPYKRSEFLRNLPIWRLYTEYFPIRLHRTVELDPKRNYILAYQPHGIISHGAFGNFCTEATGFKQLFPGIKNTLLTLEQSFTIPFNREYLLAMGLASVSKKSCEALLRGDGIPKKKAGRRLFHPTTWFSGATNEEDAKVPEGGRAITIVIGGARESLEAQPGTMKLVLKKRRGFLKLAIREGAGVVPVLSFGENDLYEQVVPRADGWIHRMQIAVKKTLGFTVPLIHARGVFNYDVGLLPYRHEINTVVGAPIFPRRKTSEPTDEEVVEFQQRYIDELRRMWDEWKDVFADDRRSGADGELEIIE
ncbi:diacylglycerol acyltransferase-domain-containing protein [Tricharina praecox]|uniref:diacylglycerol acyltransferase-domain-containing protein n=1 Tax=Tricharina praecox TaxID=43433 RepID=UPI00221F4203|nr:diacylglycerol acyltransferase-domain-containing protein [Tricharina praecox]KAI5848977.1 diacylglycerol acyltransferase-domain-containing protein [Tricharina praecox]